MGPDCSQEPRLRLASLESQSEIPPEEALSSPREPLLTLPAALTAYVALFGGHPICACCCPPISTTNWMIDVFGFIPKRYDSTLLAIDFPGGEGAKVWTFVTSSAVCTPI